MLYRACAPKNVLYNTERELYDPLTFIGAYLKCLPKSSS